jgi:hypothetical protein
MSDKIRLRKRLHPLGVACAVCAGFVAITFPTVVLLDGDAEEWGRFVLGPSLLVTLDVAVAGWVAPTWWSWRRTTALAVLGTLAVSGSLRREAQLKNQRLPPDVEARIFRHLEEALDGGPPRRDEGERDASVVLEVAVEDFDADPYADAGRPPSGVVIWNRADPPGHAATVSLSPGDNDDDALARVRPWFESLPLPRGRRFAYGVWERVATRDFDVHVVATPPALAVHANEIASASIAQPFGDRIRLDFTTQARERIVRDGYALAGKQLVYVVDGRVTWAPFHPSGFADGTIAFVRSEDGGVGLEPARAARVVANLAPR